MKVVALLSGGKDSLFNLHLATKDNHELVAIANLKPADGKDELDSYMYQTVGHQAIGLIAESLGKPLFRANISCQPVNKNLNYDVEETDEVELLYQLLWDIRHKHKLEFDAISVGAIASSYQKSRCENICKRLNLTMLAYLWDQDQDILLQSMIDNNFHAIIIKVACLGLDQKHLGLSIEEMQPLLRDLNLKYGTNICGEGGEYESLVLDCPLYKKRLVIDKCDTICHSNDVIAPVYYLKPMSLHLQQKPVPS